MSSPVDDWTEGRFNAFVVSALRGGMRRFPNKWRALEKALHGSGVNEATGRKAKLYTCASCAKLFTAKAIEIDHIEPVVDPKKGFTTWDEYISRLFCTVGNLQALCRSCHKEKTKNERSTRVHKMQSQCKTRANVKRQAPKMRAKQLVQGVPKSIKPNMGKKQPRKSASTGGKKKTSPI